MTAMLHSAVKPLNVKGKFMNFVSAVKMFKIGVGQSNSHTLCPWRAAMAFIDTLTNTAPNAAFQL
jgi:Serine dehydratase beta chain